MFPDLLFELDNLCPKVWVTPGIVASHIQVEPVDVRQQGNGKDTASVSQEWKAAEKRVGKQTPPLLLLEMFGQGRSRPVSSLATLHDEKHNY